MPDRLQGVSKSVLLEIAVRAQTLDERLRDPAPRPHTRTPRPGVTRAISLWRKKFSPGDRQALEDRLRWDGLEIQTAAERLEAPMIDPSLEFPEWIATLSRSVALAAPVADELEAGTLEIPAARESSEPPPFAELWIPFLRFATSELRVQAPELEGQLSPGALQALERHLLDDLGAVAASAVYEKFSADRADGQGPAPGIFDLLTRSRQRQRYLAFVLAMLRRDLPSFLGEYAALARQLCRLVDTWIASNAEFLDRLRRDRQAITDGFGDGGNFGRVEEIVPGLSDRHRGGRQVVRLTFASGKRIVYKPRTVAMELAFGDFLAWLKSRRLSPVPDALRVLPGEGYGWVAFVGQQAAESHEEVRRYFEAAGVLLCLTYVLRAADLHMENVVATRRGPVLVDVEALLQPRTDRAEGPKSAIRRAADRVDESVLASELLNCPQTGPDGEVNETSGLRGVGGFKLPRQLCWRFVNSDGMHPVMESGTSRPLTNVFYLGDEAQRPESSVEDLVQGFSTAYRDLLRLREDLLAEGGPLETFEGARSRVILRPTNVYALVLHHLTLSGHQREGIRQGFLIDSLNRGFSTQLDPPTLWPLVADERRALEGLDIPYFSVAPHETVVSSSRGAEVEGHFTTSGLSAVRDRLVTMSETDLEQQIDLLRSFLIESTPRHVSVENTAVEGGWDGVGQAMADDDVFVAEATAIGASLRERAIVGDDGAVTWIAPSYLQAGLRTDEGSSYYLFGGASGIAVFLAALSAVTGDEEYDRLARAACVPIADALERADLERIGLGVCTGLGAILYPLVLVGRLLGDPRFIDLAARVAAQITEKKIRQDRILDVEGGTAGAILALLALHAALPGEPWILERAEDGGNHLIRSARPAGDGALGWPAWNGRLLAGFAHGAAGSACALLRLYACTGNPGFRSTALGAFEYERRIFEPEARNWPVLQSGEERRKVFMTGWCHGAPGIALARLTAPEALDDGATRAEAEAALKTTAETGLSQIDHLCCGNMGRADVLLTAGRILRRAELEKEARRRSALVVQRARARQAFGIQIDDDKNRVFSPGFFQGLSGIGYQLLRLAHPAALPSVLAFEIPTPAKPTEK